MNLFATGRLYRKVICNLLLAPFLILLLSSLLDRCMYDLLFYVFQSYVRMMGGCVQCTLLYGYLKQFYSPAGTEPGSA